MKKSIAFFIVSLIAILSLIALLPLVKSNEDITSGFGEMRYEGEFKLDVPSGIADKVYSYLLEKYSNPLWISDKLKTSYENETFVDIYFDTRNLEVDKKWGGIRKRMRYDSSGELTKELFQVKVTPKPEETNLVRAEYKWLIQEIKKDTLDELDNHALYYLILHEEREEVNKRINESFNVNSLEVSQSINLKQERKRIYLQDVSTGETMITITLDETFSKKLYASVNWFELELEMNEIQYTSGTKEQRLFLEDTISKIKEDVTNNFPEIKQDQTPKYSKALEKLREKIPFYNIFVKWKLI